MRDNPPINVVFNAREFAGTERFGIQVISREFLPPDDEPMRTISFRLPDSIHEAIKKVAEREGISVDQFLATAAAEKLAAFTSVEYLEQRAARGSRDQLQRILDRVPHVPPDPGDEL